MVSGSVSNSTGLGQPLPVLLEVAPLAMCWDCSSSLPPEYVELQALGEPGECWRTASLQSGRRVSDTWVHDIYLAASALLCRAGEDEQGALWAVKDLHRGIAFLGDEPDLGMNPTG